MWDRNLKNVSNINKNNAYLIVYYIYILFRRHFEKFQNIYRCLMSPEIDSMILNKKNLAEFGKKYYGLKDRTQYFVSRSI